MWINEQSCALLVKVLLQSFKEQVGIINWNLTFPYHMTQKFHSQVYMQQKSMHMCMKSPTQKWSWPGLPWWRSGWESACQCRGHGFEPWSGEISYAVEQLGPWATITVPARLEPVLLNKRGRDSERPAHRDEEWPPLAITRESPHTETKTQHNQINK